MSRAKSGIVTHRRHKKILKLAKGFRGRSKNCHSIAVEKVEKAMTYAYRDRRVKKREFRALWIQRINAAVRLYGLTYSQFIHGLQHAKIEMDRKVLSDLAVHAPDSFKKIVDNAQAALKTLKQAAA